MFFSKNSHAYLVTLGFLWDSADIFGTPLTLGRFMQFSYASCLSGVYVIDIMDLLSLTEAVIIEDIFFQKK